MTTNKPLRWMVADRNNSPIYTGYQNHDNAESDAADLNRDGLPEFKPYRVIPDTKP